MERAQDWEHATVASFRDRLKSRSMELAKEWKAKKEIEKKEAEQASADATTWSASVVDNSDDEVIAVDSPSQT